MRSISIPLLTACLTMFVTGCGETDGNEQANAEPDHVWKGQTQALETAREVAGDVEERQSNMDDRLRNLTGKQE